jgi:hypothetical protein
MTPDTPITIISNPGKQQEVTDTTWGAFVAANDDDTVSEVAEQIAECFQATIGGGAAPVVWVFA